jgi:PhnB protein
MATTSIARFAPELYIGTGTRDISFYIDGLGAQELRRWSNDDGSIHVAELSVNGAIFHLHEEASRLELKSPLNVKASTVLIGLFVEDVDALMKRAIAAGAEEISPAQDYEYGYRQGSFRDPFGHEWMIEKTIS